MKKDDCIFCKIANGEIPSNTLYEDDSFRVILDLGPATKGHALVMPKEHFGNLYELLDDWCQKAFSLTKKMALTSFRIMVRQQDRLFLISIST